MVSLEIAAYNLCLEPRTLGERPLPFFIFIFYYVFIVLSTKYFKSIKTTSSKQIFQACKQEMLTSNILQGTT